MIQMVMTGSVRTQAEDIGRRFGEGLLDRTGFDPVEDEEIQTAALRSAALWNASLFGSQKSIDFALEQYDRLLKTGEKIHVDINGTVHRVVAWSRPESFEEMAARFEKTDSEQERMILAAALGSVNFSRLDDAVRFALDKIPPRLTFVPFRVMAGIPELGPSLWDMFLQNREKLEELPEFHYESILIGIITSGGLHHAEDVKRFFKHYSPEKLHAYLPYLRQTLDMALEILDSHLRLRHSLPIA